MMNGSWTAPRNPPYCPGIRLEGPGMLSQLGSETLRGTPGAEVWRALRTAPGPGKSSEWASRSWSRWLFDPVSVM